MEEANGSSPHRCCPPEVAQCQVHRYLDGEPEMVWQIDAWIEATLVAGPIRSPAEREDLKQLVHLKLLQNLRRGSFRRQASLRTYACRITRFTVIDHLRRLRLESTRREARWPAVVRGPQRTLESKELAARLLAALDRCPPRCRKLWSMIHDEGLTYPQIAASLGVPLGTVKSRVWTCRRRLRRELEIGGLPRPGEPLGLDAPGRSGDDGPIDSPRKCR